VRALREQQTLLEVLRIQLDDQRARLAAQRVELHRALASLREQRARAGVLIAELVREIPLIPLPPVQADRTDLQGTQHQTEEPGRQATRARSMESGEALRRPEQSVVDALAWLEGVGLSPARELAVACLAGYRVRSAGWVALRRRLCRRGLLVTVDGVARLALSETGRGRASLLQNPGTADELHAVLAARLDVPERSILGALLAAHPGALELRALARRCRCDPEGDVFRAARDRLLEIGLVEVSAPVGMRAHDALLRYGRPAATDPRDPYSGAQAAEGDPTFDRRRPQLLHGGLRFTPGADSGARRGTGSA
jgi:hypothetical protein